MTTRDPGCAINQLAAGTGLAEAGAAEDEAGAAADEAGAAAEEAGADGFDHVGRDVAEVYDQTYRPKFEPSVLDPIVDLLAGLAGGGPALEFAVGTGRVALPLSARGIPVHGLELSPHMAAQLRAKPGADSVPVTIGDMTTTRVPGAPFTLVYLVANAIMNVTT